GVDGHRAVARRVAKLLAHAERRPDAVCLARRQLDEPRREARRLVDGHGLPVGAAEEPEEREEARAPAPHAEGSADLLLPHGARESAAPQRPVEGDTARKDEPDVRAAYRHRNARQ